MASRTSAAPARRFPVPGRGNGGTHPLASGGGSAIGQGGVGPVEALGPIACRDVGGTLPPIGGIYGAPRRLALARPLATPQ